MRYLVTTYTDRLPRDHQIIMVDGTVPGWEANPGDLHWDHHRPGGAEIQIDEMPQPMQRSLLLDRATRQPPCLVTTMVDADACCAAAWFQLPPEQLSCQTIAQLRAIAWDCDHLAVPAALSQWATFAAKAGAAINYANDALAVELGLPDDRQTWTPIQHEEYASRCFQQGTEWLIAAAQGDRPYPGEQGEADHYWEKIAAEAQILLEQQRIHLVETDRGRIAVGQQLGIGHSINPRSFYFALTTQLPIDQLRPEVLLIRAHRLGGVQYTLGSIPLHPGLSQLDYTQAIFARLTQAEQRKNPQAGSWGGRRTVGGSPWNTPSELTVAEVIALL